MTASPSIDLVDVDCPWCQSSALTFVCSPSDRVSGISGFKVSVCRDCGLMFTSRRPTADSLRHFYPDSFFDGMTAPPPQGTSFSPTTRLLLRHVYGYPVDAPNGPGARLLVRVAARLLRRDAAWVPSLASGGGRLLDVGAGSGGMMAQYQRLGWDAVGVEPSETAAQVGQAARLDIRVGTIFDAGLPSESFDAVTLNHVLEHIADPGALLKEVFRVLKPGGVLAMRVPNVSSAERRWYGAQWFPWEVPRHLTHFRPESLKMILEGTGFDVELLMSECRPSNLAENARYFVRAKTGRDIGTRFLRVVLAPVGLVLSHLGRSSDLAVMARRAVAATTVP